MSNIKNDPAYDPFPKTGKVKEYEPFIRAYARTFWKRYPQLNFQDVLFEAVKIAMDFEARLWKPELGLDFSTALRHSLKGMYRPLVGKERKYQRPLVHRSFEPVEDDKKLVAEFAGKDEFTPHSENLSDAEKEAKRLAAKAALGMELNRRFVEERLGPCPVTYGAGGNGVRLTLDLNTLVIGCQLYSRETHYARGIMARLSADLRKLIGVDLGDGRPALTGRMRAVMAHGERIEREAEQEAENQKSGDWNSVFLEAHDTLRPDFQFRRPKPQPKNPAMPRRPIISERPDLTRLSGVLSEYIDEDRVALLFGAAELLRPALDVREHAILDWLLRPEDRTLTALAGEIDITKGYASKLRGQIANPVACLALGAPILAIKASEQINIS